MKFAVIGSGVAGLTSAWLLQRGGHRVTLFERQSEVGMDAHALDLELNGVPGRVDVPLRVFNQGSWPNLLGLSQTLGVGSREIDMSHSFSTLDGQTIFSYQNVDLSRLYTAFMSLNRWLSPRAIQILSEAMQFKWTAEEALNGPDIHQQTLGQFLAANGYSTNFIYNYLYPALSTICTCSFEVLDRYPAYTIIDTLDKMFGEFNLRRVKGGTREIVSRLVREIDDVRCGVTIQQVAQTAQEGQTQVVVSTTDGAELTYDYAVIATQANHAGPLLASPSDLELETLAAFAYDAVTVTVHQDCRFMPRNRKDWAMINFMMPPSQDKAMSTVWVNRLESQWTDSEPIFQTTNPMMEADPSRVDQTIYFERAVVTHQSVQALETLKQLNQQAERQILFSGSYASAGVPLLESGVQSSLDLAQRFGVDCPW